MFILCTGVTQKIDTSSCSSLLPVTPSLHPWIMGAKMTHTTVSEGNTEHVLPTIIRSYYESTNHQLEERQGMDNYYCLS